MADSPPPAYSYLEGALPPAYTLGAPAAPALHEIVEDRRPTVTSPAEATKTTGIEDIPTELLHSIICLACSFTCDDPDLPELRVCQKTTLCCCLVSRKWRDVTASHKELWTRVLDTAICPVSILWRFLQFTEPYLFNVGHRSAPVTLSWPEETTHDVYGMIKLICQSGHRIRELHVEVGFGGPELLLPHICDTKMPHLEAVTWHRKLSDDSAAPAHDRSYSLPEAPYKRLDFRHTLVVLRPTSCLRSLTALSMYNSPSMTLPSWLNALRSATQLRFLSIHSSIRFGGPVPAIPWDGVQLTNLVLLTIGSHTHAEAVHHLALLAAINIPPKCGLQIVAIPYIRNSQWRAVLASKIFKLMEPFAKQELGLELFVDEGFHVTMGNVRDPLQTLDWVQLGEQKVLDYLRPLQVPALTIASHAATMDEACKVFRQIISYFGSVTYDKVASFRMTLSTFGDLTTFVEECVEREELDHPQLEEFLSGLYELFESLHRVRSLSVNDQGVLAIFISSAAGPEGSDEEVVVQTTKQDNSPFVPNFPLLQDITLHATQSVVGISFAREFISARLSLGYPLRKTNFPIPLIDWEYFDEEVLESILEEPIAGCHIVFTRSAPLADSAYFYNFCLRT